MSEQADIETALARATAAYKIVRAERDALKDANDRAETAEAENDRLRIAHTELFETYAQQGLTAFKAVEEVRTERDRLREAMKSILQWSEAYPLNIFQEPDLNEAHRLLMAGGITLDAVSASTARHVVKGVGEIAHAALKEESQ